MNQLNSPNFQVSDAFESQGFISPPVLFHGTSKEYLYANTQNGYYQKPPSSDIIWCSQDITTALQFADGASESEGLQSYLLIINSRKALEQGQAYLEYGGHVSITRLATDSFLGIDIHPPKGFDYTKPNDLLTAHRDEIAQEINKSLNLEGQVEIDFERVSHGEELSPVFRF
ncbi:hypothetical protein ISS07_03420 [Candidatus Woesearchaeota archaeon]|nr:hypothetical protein [Candidatus Woesearchaeota archaeon]